MDENNPMRAKLVAEQNETARRMTAPDSVERVVAEMREAAEAYAGHHASGTFRRLADRLQALARGPQQAGGEVAELFDWLRWLAGDKREVKALEQHYAALQAEVARLREKVKFDDMAMTAVANDLRACGCSFDGKRTPIIRNDRAETAEAALREANRDALRMMWSAAKSNGGTLVIHRDALVKAGSGQLDRVNRMDGSIEYRAVDNAALNGGQDDAT